MHDVGRLADGRVFYVMKWVKGTTLRVCERSDDMGHSINVAAEDLARQVKKHRDKRRKRREAHRASPRLA